MPRAIRSAWRFSPAKVGAVSIALDVKGLPPGEHALHFHAVPKCEAPFASAGGHFNPANKKHGMQTRKARTPVT